MGNGLRTPRLWKMYLTAIHSCALKNHGPVYAAKVFGRTYKDALELVRHVDEPENKSDMFGIDALWKTCLRCLRSVFL